MAPNQYICSYCSKAFTKRSDLLRRSLVHTVALLLALKNRDISGSGFFRPMKVLDSTHREEHFAIDNPEIREHYVHETRLTGFNPAFDLGWKSRICCLPKFKGVDH